MLLFPYSQLLCSNTQKADTNRAISPLGFSALYMHTCMHAAGYYPDNLFLIKHIEYIFYVFSKI